MRKSKPSCTVGGPLESIVLSTYTLQLLFGAPLKA